MEVIRKWFIKDDKNILRKSALWNLISSVEYSLQSAVLMLIVARAGGLYDAGVFTIAYTLTQMMATIGSYGMRSFQVSDIKNEYSFGSYLSSRVLSILAMIVICMSYGFYQGYDGQKLFIIAMLCGYRIVDDLEDVFHGEMQKAMRLDTASKILAVRILAATAAFGISYVITKNLVISSVVFTLTAAALALYLNLLVTGFFKNITFKLEKTGVIKLLWVCLPICLGGFLYNYLVNAPKYAIDRNLSEETQTIFSILFMPVFVINMLSSFIFKPMIVNMGILWNEGKKKGFIVSVAKQMLIIIALTLICMLGGWLIGIQVLGFMYGVNLEAYRLLFTLLIAFGGVAALVSFLVVVLTIIRKQNYIMLAYGIGVATDWLFIDKIVTRYEIWGAGVIYGAAMSVIGAVMMIVLFASLHRRKVVKND
ncbi:MAG: hypothetical protein K1W00_05610 [Lachnospiraceae bacterium]